MAKVSIIIPALNEAEAVADVINGIPRDLMAKERFETEVLVVDGGSTDGTVELARQAGARVVYEPLRGYGRALKTGFREAAGEILVTADADGSYPMELIPDLVRLLVKENLGFITTNRFPMMEPGAMTLLNRVGNTILSVSTRLLFNIALHDVESGMWVFRRELLPRMSLLSDTWPLSHELKIQAICSAKARWREVTIPYRPRLGTAKLTPWQAGFLDLVHIVEKRLRWNDEHRHRV